MIRRAGLAKDDGLLDVGGGASTLVDHLLADGYTRLAVLDLSSTALEHACHRLCELASRAEWIVADVTEIVSPAPFLLWHDRAVFHFLTETADRRRYVDTLRRTVPPGGHVIIANFAPDGLEKRSGLEVCRHTADSVGAELGPEFVWQEPVSEIHRTPWESEQAFGYYRFQRKPGASAHPA